MGYFGKIMKPSYWKKGFRYMRQHGVKAAMSRFLSPAMQQAAPGREEDRDDGRTSSTPAAPEPAPVSWPGDYDSWTRAHVDPEDIEKRLSPEEVDLPDGWVLLADPLAQGLTYAPSVGRKVREAAAAHPESDFIYTDEDSFDAADGRYKAPVFKPDFSPDYLSDVNYISHGVAVKKTLLSAVGGPDRSFGGAAYYDLILRLTEQAKEIIHLPGALCHNRYGTNGFEHRRPEADMDDRIPENRYAESVFGLPDEDRENCRRAVEAHNLRCGIRARVTNGPRSGICSSLYEVEGNPLVSVIIPNKDHPEDLEKCVRSVLEKSAYKNVEVVIVENNSEGEEIFSCYDRLQKNPAVRVVFYQGGFNYSAINNFGVSKARGEYLLLLNNDTEMVEAGTIGNMLGRLQREDVGIVGAKLLYPDGAIQHGGVIVGLGGAAAHAFTGFPGDSEGYLSRLSAATDLSAVTAACLMVKRKVWDEVHGLREDLAVAFNDIDFCLRVRQTGRLVVLEPHAVLTHYESRSRGSDDSSPEKRMRFDREISLFASTWRNFILDPGDPYYNPFLSTGVTDFSLRP